MTTHAFGKFLLILCLVVVVGFIAYSVLYAPDTRTTGERIGDAIDQLDDRTPADKLNDAAEDIGDDIKKTTNPQ